MWLVPALAGEALSLPPGVETDVDAPDLSWSLSWSEVGFRPAAPEALAMGPDHLAIGPAGRWALWDPVLRLVRTDDEVLAVDHVDSLAFAPDGDLLLLNTTSRTLSRWRGGELVGAVPMDRLCPSQVALAVRGEIVGGVDVFGNLHPLADLSGDRLAPADAPRLLAPAHRVRLSERRVLADGVPTPVEGAVAARIVGDWVVAELGERGAVESRVAYSLTTGRLVELGSRRAAPYRPIDEVAADVDGGLAWLEPTATGLRVHRVTP